MGEIVLVPLRCNKCNALLEEEEGQVFFLCSHCLGGNILEGEKIFSKEIQFVSPKKENISDFLWLPFWVLDCEFKILSLVEKEKTIIDETRLYDFNDFGEENFEQLASALQSSKIKSDKEKIKEGDLQRVSIYVPGFETTNFANYTLNLGEIFTSLRAEMKFLTFKPSSPTLEKVVYKIDDAEKIAKIIYLHWITLMQNLLFVEFLMTVKNAELLAFPFYKEKEYFVDSQFGAKILVSALKKR